ncbi:hypothetical protein D3C84_731200 [compost metagenome]
MEFDEAENVVEHINSSCLTLNKVVSQISTYDEIIERVYDTNFELRVSLNDSGEVVVNKDWYECGY